MVNQQNIILAWYCHLNKMLFSTTHAYRNELIKYQNLLKDVEL